MLRRLVRNAATKDSGNFRSIPFTAFSGRAATKQTVVRSGAPAMTFTNFSTTTFSIIIIRLTKPPSTWPSTPIGLNILHTVKPTSMHWNLNNQQINLRLCIGTINESKKIHQYIKSFARRFLDVAGTMPDVWIVTGTQVSKMMNTPSYKILKYAKKFN